MDASNWSICGRGIVRVDRYVRARVCALDGVICMCRDFPNPLRDGVEFGGAVAYAVRIQMRDKIIHIGEFSAARDRKWRTHASHPPYKCGLYITFAFGGRRTLERPVDWSLSPGSNTHTHRAACIWISCGVCFGAIPCVGAARFLGPACGNSKPTSYTACACPRCVGVLSSRTRPQHHTTQSANPHVCLI